MIGTLTAAKLIKRISSLMELAEENELKTKAFKNAERILSFKNEPLEQFVQRAKNKKVKGIGSEICIVLEQLLTDTKPEILLELENKVPSALAELLKIKGLGAKKILALNKHLNIHDLTGLNESLENGSILTIKGFAEKNTHALKEALDFYLETKGWIRLDTHEELLRTIKSHFKNFAPNLLIEEFGCSLVKEEIFDRLELITTSSDLESIYLGLKKLGFKLDKQPSTDKLKIFTGNAVKLHLHLSSAEINLDRSKHNKSQPQLKLTNLKGVIHSHSNYSDGLNSISEMAEACIASNFEYLVISDHSQSASYANGLSPARIEMQIQEINKLNSQFKNFRIFKSIESDILKNGSLDYEPNVLSSLELIIVSIHSNFELTKELMTERILTAMDNKFTTILAHPTGRLLLERKGYEIDIDKILNKAKENNIVIELNCNPKRLDLSWKFIAQAQEMGIKFCLSPDAHSIHQIGFLEYGIWMARKASLRPENIINCLNVKEFENLICMT